MMIRNNVNFPTAKKKKRKTDVIILIYRLRLVIEIGDFRFTLLNMNFYWMRDDFQMQNFTISLNVQ